MLRFKLLTTSYFRISLQIRVETGAWVRPTLNFRSIHNPEPSPLHITEIHTAQKGPRRRKKGHLASSLL